jgi:hypothetical protein
MHNVTNSLQPKRLELSVFTHITENVKLINGSGSAMSAVGSSRFKALYSSCGR